MKDDTSREIPTHYDPTTDIRTLVPEDITDIRERTLAQILQLTDDIDELEYARLRLISAANSEMRIPLRELARAARVSPSTLSTWLRNNTNT